jgi:carbamoyltransferase
MALASYGSPRWLEEFRRLVRTTGDGGFVVEPIEWASYVKRGAGAFDDVDADSADLALDRADPLQEVLLELAGWLHAQTGDRVLTLAGGVALNCVANSVLWEQSPFEEVWVQPASGDSGTGARRRDVPRPRARRRRAADAGAAALGRSWSDDELEQWLRTAQVKYERPDDIAETVAQCLADDGVVAWFQGRAEYGPRALGHRSLLAHPGNAANLERMNDVKGREQFRPVAPMVLASRAAEIFTGPRPLAVHAVHARGQGRVARPDPGRDPRRRQRPRADGRPGRRAARRAHARGVRRAHGDPGRRQHLAEHRGPADRRRPPRRAGSASARARSTCSPWARFAVRRRR